MPHDTLVGSLPYPSHIVSELSSHYAIRYCRYGLWKECLLEKHVAQSMQTLPSQLIPGVSKRKGSVFKDVFFEVCCLASGILRLIPRTAPYWLSEAYGPTAEPGMCMVK